MTLKLHSTPNRQLETLAPLEDSDIKLYTCGPTVYSALTVGNWAAYIYWDLLVRTLKADGYNVNRVMNITDVGHLVSDEDGGEDKLQKSARREGKTAWDIAAFYTDDFLSGMTKLNLLPPEHLSKATDFIDEQLDLVRRLKAGSFTYQIDDGIYFDTSKFPRYAEFAGLDMDAQKAGARVELNTQKRQASDFALWKFSPKDESRDMEWTTPDDLLESDDQRMGFPGWHLECSAMAMTLLGDTIDIHTGGIDHIPVHHTNEIAQSEAATGKTFSNIWLHNNHLKVNGTKISKSLGNGYTLQDLAEENYDPLDFKLFILQGHYSNEGNFTFENLSAAQTRRQHWRSVTALRHQTHDTLTSDHDKRQADSKLALLAVPGLVREALSNNLDSPTALKIIDKAFSDIEQQPVRLLHHDDVVGLLEAIDDMLGLELLQTTPDLSDEQKQRLLERRQARDNKDWGMSDTIRDEFLAIGIQLNDRGDSSTWSYTT